MNCYEHTVIIKEDCSEKQQKELIDKYEGIINNNSGKIVRTEKWGFLNFSNPIKIEKQNAAKEIKSLASRKSSELILSAITKNSNTLIGGSIITFAIIFYGFNTKRSIFRY